jgi:hypothetical protein
MGDAEAIASLYSLIVIARAAGITQFEYLRSASTEPPKDTTAADTEALLPWI